jgi:DNA processing protein
MSVAVIGTRLPSAQAEARAIRLVRHLVDDGFTVVSGLAKGIDTVVHHAAIESGGRTIAVIGTPLSVRYPRENARLQNMLARDFLLISQIPVLRYTRPNLTENKTFFPERNITMSALTEATVIVEAGETSGTLIQARHALKQKKRLFILESNFHNPSLTWPHRFEQLGAIRVRDYGDIQKHLVEPPLPYCGWNEE